MKWPATIANSAWVGSSLPAWRAFRRALHRPAETQWNLLRNLLANNSDCDYGRAHGFGRIKDYADFARRVPLVDYENLVPWIDRIREGDQGGLTAAKVTHLIPTSGSTGARKLIPFTRQLQGQFNRAIDPWITDLALRQPQMLLGPAYWSITPPQRTLASETSVIPIGFADDASYLGGAKGELVRTAMVIPDPLGNLEDLDEFRFRTLLCLLGERDLRLISVWHPSFLSLLLDALPGHWGKILAQLGQKDKRRAHDLERANPHQPETLWPRLKVISCWGDGHAAPPLAELRQRFPNVLLQAKGLLATEAFVTIPFAGSYPAAICSHFFEFVDRGGQIHRIGELCEGEAYDVVVTTAGGLWRYHTQDEVRVTGFAGQTPTLQFIGRNGNVADLFGEKLSETFVADVIQRTFALSASKPRFALLAPDQDATGWRYKLYVEGDLPLGAAETLDRNLRQNPNYSHCRALGQLHPVEIFHIKSSGYKSFVKRLVSEGKRLGDIKPVPLSSTSGWSQTFVAN